MTIEDLFGTLQQSIIIVWRYHLNTNNMDKHTILNDYYEDMPELVDSLIETWMGVQGRKVHIFNNILTDKYDNPIDFLKKLREIGKQGYFLLKNENELVSKLDDVMGLIDSTLYKLQELTEKMHYKSLSDFLQESVEE